MGPTNEVITRRKCNIVVRQDEGSQTEKYFNKDMKKRECERSEGKKRMYECHLYKEINLIIKTIYALLWNACVCVNGANNFHSLKMVEEPHRSECERTTEKKKKK